MTYEINEIGLYEFEESVFLCGLKIGTRMMSFHSSIVLSEVHITLNILIKYIVAFKGNFSNETYLI